MKIKFFFFILFSSLLLIPAFTFAQAIPLEKRVDNFESKVPESEDMNKPSPEVQQPNPSFSTEGWNSSQNWNKLQIGMSPVQVEMILGPPTTVKGGDVPCWYYEGYMDRSKKVSGKIWFRQNRVLTITLPVF